MEAIRVFYEQEFGIGPEDWAMFSSKLHRQEFSKKAPILRAGKVENYLSFIEKGLVRFYIPQVEQDLTFGFAFAGNFVSAYDSFLTQEPATYTIETLSETVLWRISYEDLQMIYTETKVGNLIGRRASEELFLKKSKRELALLHESAETRYLKLFEDRPELIEKIPLKYIASYIGVTPQALSRIRKRIS